jgi:putative acetyltransferase
MIEIRQERARDHSQVHDVVRTAFSRDDEARLVERLRSVSGYFAFVAIEDESVIGHLSFSPITLNDAPSSFVGLAPVSVIPACQRRGIGSKLIQDGLTSCRECGHTAVFVLGNPDYYSKFGFQRADRFGFRSEYTVTAENFMDLEMESGAIESNSGVIKYDPTFAELND